MLTVLTRRELISWLIVAVLAVTTVVLARPDRVDAGASGPVTEVVYVATGDNFPDALGAAATAALGLGPVLLVQPTAIPAATLSELNRLQPSQIVIVGGPAVISTSVQNQLEGLGFSPDVTRISGANRYETAAELSSASFPTSGRYPRVAHDAHEGGSLIGVGEGIVIPGGDFSTVQSVTIEAPAPGVLVVDASLLAVTDELPGFCRLTSNGEDLAGSLQEVINTAATGSCSAGASLEVEPGVHTVELVYRVDDLGFGLSAEVVSAALTAMWVPFDGFGAPPNLP